MDTNQLLDDYMSWLRDQYTIKKIDQADEVTTPFLNMIGDNMRLYVERLSDSKLRLSDDGTTLENLLLYGINLNSPMRKQIMKETTHRYNVDLFDNVLSVTGTSANFPLMKQNLLAAMVTINDLAITKKTNIERLFLDEVFTFMQDQDFGGLPQYQISGKSGVDYIIDYTIPPKEKKPMRLINFQNRISFNQVVVNAYQYRDIATRSHKIASDISYAIIYNNSEGSVTKRAEQIARDANISLLSWSDKSHILELK